MRAPVLRLRDRLVPALWCLYAAEAAPPGNGRDGTWWIGATEALTPEESKSLDLLRHELAEGGAERRALVGAVGRGEQPVDLAVAAALDQLAPRAARVYEAAAPMLDRWRDAIGAEPPEWVGQLGARANAFYGTQVGEAEPFHYTLFLLPAEGDRAGRTGALFVPGEGSSLECAGEPTSGALDHLRHALLHSALHACQTPRGDELLVAHLATPEGHRAQESFDASPAAERQRRLFGRSFQGIVPHLAETIVHALAHEGALRELAGTAPAAEHWRTISAKAERILDDPSGHWTEADLYDAWVLGGSAQLVPAARSYLADSRPMDGEFVRRAFDAFQSLYARWDASAGRHEPQIPVTSISGASTA